MDVIRLHGGIDMLALNVVGLIVAAVDITLTHDSMAGIVGHRELLYLHHRVRQQGVMPVDRVNQRLVKAEGTVHHTDIHFHRRQVSRTGHILVQDMILDEAAQRVHRVAQVLIAVTGRIDVLRIYRVVEFAGLFVEGTDVALGNAVLLCQHFVGNDKEGKAVLLRIGYPCHLTPCVRLIVVLAVALGIPGGVVHQSQFLKQSRSNECLIIGADLRIVAQHVGDVAVGLLDDHIDGLHDTILHRVVLQRVVDLCDTL